MRFAFVNDQGGRVAVEAESQRDAWRVLGRLYGGASMNALELGGWRFE